MSGYKLRSSIGTYNCSFWVVVTPKYSILEGTLDLQLDPPVFTASEPFPKFHSFHSWIYNKCQDVHLCTKDTRQYLVWDQDGEEETTDLVTQALFQAADTDENDKKPGVGQARKKQSKKKQDKAKKKSRKNKKSSKKRKAKSTSDSESDESSKSSSSSSSLEKSSENSEATQNLAKDLPQDLAQDLAHTCMHMYLCENISSPLSCMLLLSLL